ncbi:unnamed protein product [Trifolium pratense]|uniref:Uncharacterized protein n=1 Tax=Trifolium pratense TaxID=57577 RepID=A0ACB0LAU6_TRIPR|nr:unnamed protein product [Trifolium pratense]
MTDDVGRTRGGRESRAHGSARREAAKVHRNTRQTKGKSVIVEPESEDENVEEQQFEDEHEVDIGQQASEHEDELEVEDEMEVADDVEDEMEVAEEQTPPPPEKKSRKKNPRTTQGRNPPPVSEPPVTSYDGGPKDLSLLPGFGKHVAVAIWRGDCKNRYLRCMNNRKKINDFDLPRRGLRWFWDVVDATGLRPLLKTNYNHLDWGLLTAFTERWHPETDTFHLPIGEMTITLDDVSCLLHIPITGKMLNHLGTSCTVEEGEDMCYEYLNFSRTECRKEFKKMKGAHIGFFMLDKIYTENMKAVVRAEKKKMSDDKVQHLRECTIRSFLLYLLGATFFTNKSMQYVDVIFLTYLQDLSLVNTWNWGASGLAYMYNYLDAASRPGCGNLGGYNAMFHAWILSHFERFGSRYVDVNYSHNDPIAAKYYPFKGGKYPTEHRTTLDRMEVDEVTWRPYEDHRQTRPFEDISWYTGWIMCGTAMISPYLPERVLRQFGHVQSIPRHPDVSAKAGMTRFSIAEAFADYLVANYVTEEMRGPRAHNGFETVDGYIAWFYRVSHPKLWAPIDGNPKRPTDYEVLLEEDITAEKCDVFEICKTVHAEVREKLDGDLTFEEAKELLEKVYNDLTPVVTYSVQRRKKADSGEKVYNDFTRYVIHQLRVQKVLFKIVFNGTSTLSK